MLYKTIFLTFIILSACGSEPEKCGKKGYKTSGLCIISGDLEVYQEDIDIVVQVTEEQTQIRYPKVQNITEALDDLKAKIVFVDYDINTNCEEIEEEIYRCKDAGGVTIVDKHKVYIEQRKCLAMSSLGHELLHLIQIHYLKMDKPTHETKWMFEDTTADKTTSIEYNIRENAVLALDRCYEFQRYYQNK